MLEEEEDEDDLMSLKSMSKGNKGTASGNTRHQQDSEPSSSLMKKAKATTADALLAAAPDEDNFGQFSIDLDDLDDICKPSPPAAAARPRAVSTVSPKETVDTQVTAAEYNYPIQESVVAADTSTDLHGSPPKEVQQLVLQGQDASANRSDMPLCPATDPAGSLVGTELVNDLATEVTEGAAAAAAQLASCVEPAEPPAAQKTGSSHKLASASQLKQPRSVLLSPRATEAVSEGEDAACLQTSSAPRTGGRDWWKDLVVGTGESEQPSAQLIPRSASKGASSLLQQQPNATDQPSNGMAGKEAANMLFTSNLGRDSALPAHAPGKPPLLRAVTPSKQAPLSGSQMPPMTASHQALGGCHDHYQQQQGQQQQQQQRPPDKASRFFCSPPANPAPAQITVSNRTSPLVHASSPRGLVQPPHDLTATTAATLVSSRTSSLAQASSPRGLNRPPGDPAPTADAASESIRTSPLAQSFVNSRISPLGKASLPRGLIQPPADPTPTAIAAAAAAAPASNRTPPLAQASPPRVPTLTASRAPVGSRSSLLAQVSLPPAAHPRALPQGPSLLASKSGMLGLPQPAVLQKKAMPPPSCSNIGSLTLLATSQPTNAGSTLAMSPVGEGSSAKALPVSDRAVLLVPTQQKTSASRPAAPAFNPPLATHKVTVPRGPCDGSSPGLLTAAGAGSVSIEAETETGMGAQHLQTVLRPQTAADNGPAAVTAVEAAAAATAAAVASTLQQQARNKIHQQQQQQLRVNAGRASSVSSLHSGDVPAPADDPFGLAAASAAAVQKGLQPGTAVSPGSPGAAAAHNDGSGAGLVDQVLELHIGAGGSSKGALATNASGSAPGDQDWDDAPCAPLAKRARLVDPVSAVVEMTMPTSYLAAIQALELKIAEAQQMQEEAMNLRMRAVIVSNRMVLLDNPAMRDSIREMRMRAERLQRQLRPA